MAEPRVEQPRTFSHVARQVPGWVRAWACRGSRRTKAGTAAGFCPKTPVFVHSWRCHGAEGGQGLEQEGEGLVCSPLGFCGCCS